MPAGVWLYLLNFLYCLSKLQGVPSPLTSGHWRGSPAFILDTWTEVPNTTVWMCNCSGYRLWSSSRVISHLSDLLISPGFLVRQHILGTWHSVWPRFWGHCTQPCPWLNQAINFPLDIVGMEWKSCHYPCRALWDPSRSELLHFRP